MEPFSPLRASLEVQHEGGYNVQEQNEMVSQLQAANFDLKMQVHGLNEELSRRRKQNGTPGDKSGELERNKALLVKARQAISKLQAERDGTLAQLRSHSRDPAAPAGSAAETFTLRAQVERAEERVNELERQLKEANAMIDNLHRELSGMSMDKSRISEDAHALELHQSIHAVTTQALEQELKVKQKETQELSKGLNELQSQVLLRHEELKIAHAQSHKLHNAKVLLEAKLSATLEAHSKVAHDMGQQLSHLRTQLGEATKEHNCERTELQAALLDSEQAKRDLQREGEEHKAKLLAAKGDLLERVGQVERFMAEEELNATRQDQVSHELKDSYRRAEESSEQAEAHRTELESKCAELDAQEQATEAERAKVAALEETITEVEATLEAEKDELQTQVGRLQVKLTASLLQAAEQAVHEAKQGEEIIQLGTMLGQEQEQVRSLDQQLRECSLAAESHAAAMQVSHESDASNAAKQIRALEHKAEREREAAEAHMLEEERRHAQEKSEGGEQRHELKTRIVNIEEAMEALRVAKEQLARDREREVHEVELKLGEQCSATHATEEQKASLETQLQDRSTALETACMALDTERAKTASQELLLRERAEAASSAARNAEYIVNECDNLRVQHGNAFAVLKERHDKMGLLLGAAQDPGNVESGDLALKMYEVIKCEAGLQSSLEALRSSAERSEADLKEELRVRTHSFEAQMAAVQAGLQGSKARVEHLEVELGHRTARVGELEHWLQRVAGKAGVEEAQELLVVRSEQHQQVLVDIGEQLRAFLVAFPSHDARVHDMIPTLNTRSTYEVWSEEDFSSLRQGLLVSLRCVLSMFHAVEERWQRQYAELDKVIEVKTQDLHRLEVAISTLQRTQQLLPGFEASIISPAPVPNPQHTRSNNVALHAQLSEQKHRNSVQSEQMAKEMEDKDVLRQTSLECSIGMLAEQITNLKSELEKERTKEQTAVAGQETSKAMQDSRHRIQRLAENNRVLILELEEKRLTQEKAMRELAARDQQAEVLQAEIKRLRNNPPQLLSQCNGSPMTSKHNAPVIPLVPTALARMFEAQTNGISQTDSLGSHPIIQTDSLHRMAERLDTNGGIRPGYQWHSNQDGSIDRNEFAAALQEGQGLLQGTQEGYGQGLLQGIQFNSLKDTTDTFRSTGESLQRLRQECADYREELSRLR